MISISSQDAKSRDFESGVQPGFMLFRIGDHQAKIRAGKLGEQDESSILQEIRMNHFRGPTYCSNL